jgi:hypothetical protein
LRELEPVADETYAVAGVDGVLEAAQRGLLVSGSRARAAEPAAEG